jgi:molybdate transport system ATP-binding protein
MLEVTLAHAFPGFALDVAFRAPAGVTALFGRSGSGKTSIVNAVAGLLRPDRGRIVAGGTVLTDTGAGLHVPVHRRRVGYVFQEGRLFPHMTVRANLTYGRRDEGGPAMAHIVDLLGIGPLLERRPGALSGGEKARVALGRAILSDPRLLLMDEPLAALDEARKAEILPYLERLRDETGVPILYVSHAAAEVARLANTLVMVDAGRVTRAGPAADLLADPALALAFGLRDAGAILTLRIAEQEGDGLTRLDGPTGPLWLPRVAGGAGTPVRVRILAQDVMLALARPEGVSALNILPGVVRQVRLGEGPGALVQVALGDALILARVTRRSAETLGLVPGLAVQAVIKSVAVAARDVGDAGGRSM